jgi:mono/diheme cytochrome c family protein
VKGYPGDLIAQEKADPVERASTTFLPVPLLLWSLFLLFGIGYLRIQTPGVALAGGDKRSPRKVAAVEGQNQAELGAAAYKRNCQACHQPDGRGLAGAFPPLAGSEWVTGEPDTLSAIVLRGLQGEITVQGKAYKGVMPAFAAQITAQEMAALLSFLRSSWGNQADPVPVTLIQEMTEKTRDRKQPWKGQVELQSKPWEL